MVHYLQNKHHNLTGMAVQIQISRGTGSGPTEIAAFDQALVNAGIANCNLLYLSSVLPPKSSVIEVQGNDMKLDAGWGDRLYVVMAQLREQVANQEAWAGIGWIQDEQTGAGLLVEHTGQSESAVRTDIQDSLAALASNRNQQFGPVHMAVAGVKCVDQPVCALVAAVFESEPWRAAID